MAETGEKRHMKAAFLSNYINHHQIPFCDEMYRLLNGEFTFIQTEPMEEERIRMGWRGQEKPPYVKCWYDEPGYCSRLMMECDVVLFGGTDDESYIQERLKSGKPVIRISERLYKTGQWKAVSPRGLKKKYMDHTRYRNRRVYMLCCGAYVPSDFHIIRAYKGKMYCWGYFPATRRYDVDDLFCQKGWVDSSGQRLPYLLWTARMIDLKHPELALETADYLKKRGYKFHIDIIGDGKLRGKLEELNRAYGLEDVVSFLGFLEPEKVRSHMEKADIFLFTSDRHEGWGAVVNEAMNSGCAIVADHMIGSVPYLVNHGVNGLAYRDGSRDELFRLTERLVSDGKLCHTLGKNAYRTITEDWNAQNAAQRLCEFMEKILQENPIHGSISGKKCFQGALSPCDPAPLLKERHARGWIRKHGADFFDAVKTAE